MACNCSIYNNKISGKMMFFTNPLSVAFIPDHSCNSIAQNITLTYRKIQDFLDVIECTEEEFLAEFQDGKTFDCIFSVEKLRKLGFMANPYKRGELSIVQLIK